MNLDQVKTITVVTNKLDVVRSRRHIAGWAIARGLRVVAYEERPSRLTTELDVTVSGHPRRVREFHDDIRGDAWTGASDGDLAGWIVGSLFVEV